MLFNGFEQQDFTLFSIGGLDQRMAELKRTLRPKFESFGQELSLPLQELTGETMFPHVAKHARRKTNPPDDSWVAFASNPRGYKMLPHFQICVWETHLLIQWGIIYEAKNKEVFAKNLLLHVDEVIRKVPSYFQWSKDHMKPGGTLHSDMKRKDFEDFARRLLHNKNGEVMVGLSVPKEEAVDMSAKEFYDLVLTTWNELTYLHNLAK
jgi:uncharacterized protein YktB (UPF0637 family)